MIALMILAGIAIWLVVVIVLTVWIPRILGAGWPRAVARLILFPVLVVLPVVDRWIGRWQFEKLCAQNVMHLSPDWQNVKRAKNISPNYPERLRGYATRIQKSESKYQDIDSGEIFLHYNSYYNYGGFLMDNLSLALSGAPQDCWPKDYDLIRREIHLQKLLDQGEIND